MVAVGEGYCTREMLAKIFLSALCSDSRAVNCDRRTGVVWIVVVYSTYRLTYFHRRRGVCVGDGRECVGSAMLKSKSTFVVRKALAFRSAGVRCGLTPAR
jgi:hypothetical protein